MKNDAWFCMDCMQVRDLDIHARCFCCGSDSVTPAASGPRQPITTVPALQVRMPFIFKVTRKELILRQAIDFVVRTRQLGTIASREPVPVRS